MFFAVILRFSLLRKVLLADIRSYTLNILQSVQIACFNSHKSIFIYKHD